MTTQSQLKRGQVGLLGVMMPGLAQVGPAFNILFTVGLVVSLVGKSTPLMYLIGMLGIAATANTFAQFSRKYSSSGSFLAFISRGLGAPVAVVAGVMALLGYIISFGGIYIFVGQYITQNLLGNPHVPGLDVIVTVVFGALVTIPAILGLSTGVRTSIVLYVVEVAILLTFIIGVVAQGGAHGLSLSPFTFDGVTSAKSMALALSLTILAFGGFEAAAPLAEETSRPRRNVPIALLVNVLISGILYIGGAYALVIAFGTAHTASLASDPNPFETAAKSLVPVVGGLVVWVFLTSITSSYVAANLETSRVIYAGARGGLWWKSLSRIHPRFGTPWIAAVAFVAPSVVIGAISTAFTDPTTASGFLGTLGTLGVVVMYAVTNLALAVSWFRDRRLGKHGNPLTQLVLPVVGIAVLIIPIWGDLQPGQAAPYKYLPWCTIGLAVVAVAYMLGLRFRRPEVMARATDLLVGEVGEDTGVADDPGHRRDVPDSGQSGRSSSAVIP
ncbi:APC family permease [Streptomyces sp. NPDC002758]